ncbi:MAG TPA: hypothetical protein VMW10_11765 [Alphaproteobacteria bacterium]|nr:hypothetical protein [Alphaproteobacteria bacterium]
MLNADLLNENKILIDGMWVVARPIKNGFIRRLKGAIQVLRGKAEAVKFYKQ